MKYKIILLFIFSITVSFAQNNRFDYKTEAAKGELNYFQIVKKKKEEIKSYDLTKISNIKAIKQFNRWAFTWRDRVDSQGNFPSSNLGFYNANILDKNGKIKNENLLFQRSQINTENWTNVGPQTLPDINGSSNQYGQNGRLNCFLRFKHPTDKNQDVLFVGAPNGGVWKSIDGGSTWVPKLDFVAGIGVTDIKSTPDADFSNYTTKPIFVSTGDYDSRDANSIGVLKSMDGGETFASTGLSYTLDQRQIIGELHVFDENNVIVGGHNAVLRTTDGGAVWNSVYAPTDYSSSAGLGFGRIAVNGNEVIISALFEIAYTEDYTVADSWERVGTTSSTSNKHAVTLGEDGSFYVQGVDGQVKKFDKTTKSLVDFGTITPGYNPQGGYNQTLLIKNNMMISGGVNASSSVNSGVNWYKSLNGYKEGIVSDGVYVHPDHHGIGQLDGDYEFWVVHDGGLEFIDYGSDPSNQKPETVYKSEGVYVTQSYAVSINPASNDGAYIIDNQDTGSFSKKDGNWYSIFLGDGIQSAINYNTPDTRYAANQNGLIVQSNTGFIGQNQGNGKSETVPGAYFYFPLEINKTNPNILYAGGDEVYKLEDDLNFTITSLNSGAGSAGVQSAIRDIATHGNSILAAGYVDDTNKLRFSSDGGDNWSEISFFGGTVNSVDFDANDNNIMYLTVSGYNNINKVFKSIDGGTNFTNITGDLPNIVMKEVLLKQNQSSETLFLATEIGVYFSLNGGTNWNRLGNGLPNVDIRDLEIHYTNDKLVAASYGRGLWEISIAKSTLSNKNVNADLKSINIFPNPTQDFLNINIENSEDYNYLIYNVIGGVVKKGKLDSNQKIDVKSLPENMYMLRIYNKNKSFVSKFIKNNN